MISTVNVSFRTKFTSFTNLGYIYNLILSHNLAFPCREVVFLFRERKLVKI